ncbi:mucin-4 [Bombyx mori]|uniref:receptor protein-tyrosine kinase n=1 Tax=Bombyx mori TaxID=7091 RepID=A0A8R2R7R2_BOMMO|nr:uncharacterized protein LOC101745605 isoform X2 [Bombyx mori]
MKMRELIRITFVCVCAFLLAVREGRGEDVPKGLEGSLEQDVRKDSKTSPLSANNKRVTTPSSTNATRDSQLFSLLAARRRLLLSGRLTSHINTLAAITHKPHKTNTTFAHLEVKHGNSSLVRKVIFDNSSREAGTPVTLKLITTDGSRETRQDIKPHEIRHIFIPKLSPENRNRSGYRRREPTSILKSVTIPEQATEGNIVYVPPDKIEEEKDVDLDPEEEFQVDESNHGLYLLNYSDTDNVTQGPDINKTTISNEIVKENTSTIIKPTTIIIVEDSKENDTIESKEDEITEINTIANSTEQKNYTLAKNDLGKTENQTLFLSDEIYNHFRPLETELPVEDMAPFIYFGKKLGGTGISDNLTNSPSFSASTKTINYLAPPQEKRKFNSRYSATEKYKNSNADEDEINEDMDVSVVKNIIEKNKVRNTVKGPAPARHVGLVNAYRKLTTTSTTTTTTPSTTKSPNFAQLNVTERIVQNVALSTVENFKNTSNNSKSTDIATKFNFDNGTKDYAPRYNATTSRNFTRNYFNLRRRPTKLIASPTTEVKPTVTVNTTTEKVATAVYTAVVTSVSITSSMKGQNKSDATDDVVSNTTVVGDVIGQNATTPKTIPGNETETTTVAPSTIRHHRFRIKLRTSTPSGISKSKPTESATTSELSTTNSERDESVSRITETLTSLLQKTYENTTLVSTIRPRSAHRRRRPTTTTTTSTTSSAPTTITPNDTGITHSTELPATTQNIESTTFKPFTVTSMKSSESSSKPLSVSRNTTLVESKVVNLSNSIENSSSQNGVVIEAEKTYTASYVLAGLGFLPVAAIIIFVLRNLLNKKTKEIDTEYEGYFDDAEVKKESPITPVARPPLPPPTKPDQKWEFPRNKLRLQTLLGQGNFGQVWKAEADDLNGHDGLTRLVAVKTIKETASQKEKQELLHEIYIMQKIGTHPNVVTLLACCTEQEPYLLIMEYVMCGKLLTYLRERRARPDRFAGSGALTSRDLTVFAYCVARGMDYIASKGIVHRDLAARNVLVDHNKLCKIADFGMSRCAGAARNPRTALPVRWMAPEALLYSHYSHHSDVWAFGILLWEIVTLGSTPYATMSGREVLAAVTEGYRLERPAHCKPQLYRAMHSCWHADPAQRPAFSALKAQLADLLHNETAEGNYVDLDSFYQDSSVYSDPSAIIHDDDGLSAEYDRERRCFRELTSTPSQFDNRAFNLRDEELRNKFGIGTPRMGGFGIRDVPFNERPFSDAEFNDRPFADKNFTDNNFNDTNFTERKDGKLSTSSFHRERERENPLVSRNSFNGFPRIGTREGHFQITPDGRNKRVPEFECDI